MRAKWLAWGLIAVGLGHLGAAALPDSPALPSRVEHEILSGVSRITSWSTIAKGNRENAAGTSVLHAVDLPIGEYLSLEQMPYQFVHIQGWHDLRVGRLSRILQAFVNPLCKFTGSRKNCIRIAGVWGPNNAASYGSNSRWRLAAISYRKIDDWGLAGFKVLEYRLMNGNPRPAFGAHFVNRLLADCQAFPHMPGLAMHRPPLKPPQDHQEESKGRNGSSVEPTPPRGRRLTIALVGLLCLWPMLRCGFAMIDRKQRWLGGSVIVAAYAVAGGGLALLYVTAFRWSWNWLI